MRYPDGQEVIIGDIVSLNKSKDSEGVVVCSLDRGEYSKEFTQEQWGYLKKGILIEFTRFGLIHYEEPDSDLELVSRKE